MPLETRGESSVAAKLRDVLLKANWIEEGSGCRSQPCCWRVLFAQNVAEDLSCLLLHAAAVAFGLPLQACFDLGFQIADQELCHCDLHPLSR